VEMLCSLAERLRGALVRAGDIAVEGHCDIESKFCHGHAVRAFALKWVAASGSASLLLQ